MRLFSCVLVLLAGMSAHAASSQQFTVPTPAGRVLVESFGNCANATCPAVVILSGSKGFGAPVYDEIGQTLRAAGLNAYLVHVLSAADLDAIATAGNARARIAYYAQRLPDWTPPFKACPPILRASPTTAARLAFSESPLAPKSPRPLRLGDPTLTLWCWSMVVSRTAIHSLFVHCRRCF